MPRKWDNSNAAGNNNKAGDRDGGEGGRGYDSKSAHAVKRKKDANRKKRRQALALRRRDPSRKGPKNNSMVRRIPRSSSGSQKKSRGRLARKRSHVFDSLDGEEVSSSSSVSHFVEDSATHKIESVMRGEKPYFLAPRDRATAGSTRRRSCLLYTSPSPRDRG